MSLFAAIETKKTKDVIKAVSSFSHNLVPGLIHACERGNVYIVRVLLAAKANPETPDETGQTPLTAVSRNHEFGASIAELLIAKRANPNLKPTPALILAVKEKNVPVVEALILLGADLDARDQDGWTAMMHALPSIRLMRLLRHAPVNSINADGNSALILSIRRAQMESRSTALELGERSREIDGSWKDMVELLCSWNADVNMPGLSGLTALMYATRTQSNGDMVKFLIDQKANIDQQSDNGQTALTVAARIQSNEAMVKVLIDQKANINHQDNCGRTVLMHAVVGRNTNHTVKLLLTKKANVNAEDNEGATALTKAVQVPKDTTVRLLLEGKANVRQQDHDGASPFFYAATEGSFETVTRLKDSDVNGQTKRGWTALMAAVRDAGHAESYRIIEFLISIKADVALQNEDGITALMLFARYNTRGSLDLLRALASSGVNKTDKDGSTALIHGIGNLDTTFIRCMLGLRADAHKLNNQGRTALDVALEKSAPLEIIQLLAGPVLNVALPQNLFYRRAIEYLLMVSPVAGECLICWDEVHDVGVKLHCGHVFHTRCIETWYKNCPAEPTCPYCRRHIVF